MFGRVWFLEAAKPFKHLEIGCRKIFDSDIGVDTEVGEAFARSPDARIRQVYTNASLISLQFMI